MIRLLFLFLTFIYFTSSFAQELKLNLGTEFPLQSFIGVNYKHGKQFSADLSFGLVTSPYNNELYDWISIPSDKEPEKEFLQETTVGGNVLDFGINFHYSEWYGGLFGQSIRLDASGTYTFLLNNDFVLSELTTDEEEILRQYLNSPLALLVNFNDEVELESNLFQLGLKIGRSFNFKNPKWSAFVELSYSINLSASSSATYDKQLIQRIIDSETQITGESDGTLAEKLDLDRRVDELNTFFDDYANIPGLSFGISYHLFDWKE